MPPMHRREYIPSIVQMPRNTDLESGAPEQQMVTYQQGNSTQEDTHCQNCQRTETLGTVSYKIKCKWKNQVKKMK